MQDISFLILGNEIVVPDLLFRLFLSCIFGYLVGLEREKKRKPASIKTFSFICMGSCVFTILSLNAANNNPSLPYDTTRIAAQVVTGMGFVGGGVIFKSHDRIEGVTTAALIWYTAAMGMSIGFGNVALAFYSLIFFFFVLFLSSCTYTIFEYFRLDELDYRENTGEE